MVAIAERRIQMSGIHLPKLLSRVGVREGRTGDCLIDRRLEEVRVRRRRWKRAALPTLLSFRIQILVASSRGEGTSASRAWARRRLDGSADASQSHDGFQQRVMSVFVIKGRGRLLLHIAEVPLLRREGKLLAVRSDVATKSRQLRDGDGSRVHPLLWRRVSGDGMV